jgi:hypothetical protein
MSIGRASRGLCRQNAAHLEAVVGELNQTPGVSRMIKLKPHITGIAPETLIELDGVRGPFYVAGASLPREVDICHFYGDETYQFFVYANWLKRNEGGHDVEVQALTARSIVDGSGPQQIASRDIEYIKANISKLFRKRDFSNPKYPISLEDTPRSIVFTWALKS